MKLKLFCCALLVCWIARAQVMNGNIPRYPAGRPNGVDDDTVLVQDAVNRAAINGRPVILQPNTVFHLGLLTNASSVVIQSWATPGKEQVIGQHEANSYTAIGAQVLMERGFLQPEQ